MRNCRGSNGNEEKHVNLGTERGGERRELGTPDLRKMDKGGWGQQPVRREEAGRARCPGNLTKKGSEGRRDWSAEPKEQKRTQDSPLDLARWRSH